MSHYYVAEPFNAISSLIFIFFGCVYGAYCNATNEWRFSVVTAISISIGIGSTALHLSLHWFFQSCDEVPMLWLNSICCYCIYNNSTKMPKNGTGHHLDISACLFLFATLVGTVIYYCLQSLYIVFIMTYAITTTVIVLWCANYIFGKDCCNHANEKTLKLLAKHVFFSFFGIGLVCWLVSILLNCPSSLIIICKIFAQQYSSSL